MSQDFSRNFMHTTTLLETDHGNGLSGTGTGFFFEINHPEISEKHYSQYIATNKHVLDGARKVTAHITRMRDNRPVYGESVAIELNLIDDPERTIYHPHPDVDLCLIDISDVRTDYARQGISLYMLSFDPSMIPSEEELYLLNAMEDVVMVGYPSGLWDMANNLPIMRKGVTSSHLSFKFNNREVFVSDIACYRGSSGSPLFIHNDGMWIGRKGQNFNKSPILLVGIASQIMTEISIGSATPSDIPTKTEQPKEDQPEKEERIIRNDLNLGVFVKSYKLLDFIPIVKEKAFANLSKNTETD